jgi:hypothetical protein
MTVFIEPAHMEFEQVTMRLRCRAYRHLLEFRRYDAWWVMMGYGDLA